MDASVGILNGDSDGDGDPLSAILVNSPANGSLNLNGDGSFSYTPNPGFSGVDSFIYVANDGKDNSDVATVTIAVDVPPPPPPPNTPPVADNDSYTTGFQSPITVDASVGVLNGDTDLDGDPISAILVNSPANGSLNYFNADGSFSYTPNSGFSGVDSFVYVANDGEFNSDIATVAINVEPPPTPEPPTPNTPPVADNDNYNTAFQSPLSVDAVSGVLNGDSDGDGDPLSAILVNPPANGSLNLNGDGSFSYTPNTGFSGVDSFIYVANDGKDDSNIATVTINVEPQEQTVHRNGYSHRGEDNAQVFRTFRLTNVGNNDQIIVDQDDSGTTGFFPEAIQDFIVYETMEDGYSTVVIAYRMDGAVRINFNCKTELAGGGTLSFDDKGNPVFIYPPGTEVDQEPKFKPPISVVDLRVKLIERDNMITEFGLTNDQKEPIVELDDSIPEEIIVYQFLESGTNNIIEELVFSIENPNEPLPNKPISLDLATNSLEYIIEENLLFHTEEKSSLIQYSILSDENILRQKDANRVKEEIERLDAENPPGARFWLGQPEPLLPLEKTYSQREIDDTTILTTFLLTNNGDNYQTIDDQDDSDTRSLFPNAIQDFVTYNNGSGIWLVNLGDTINFNSETELFYEGSNMTLSFNDKGEPLFTGVDVETEIITEVDLSVKRLIEGDDIIAELELPNDTEIDDSFQGEVIVYEFLEEELFLFTNEFPDLEEFNNVFTDESLYQSDKINLATNSLESIIEDDLLSFTLKKQDAKRVILGEVTPSEARSSGEGFVNPE